MSKIAAQALAVGIALCFPTAVCASREEWLGAAGWLCANMALLLSMAALRAMEQSRAQTRRLANAAIAENTRLISEAYEAHIRQLREEPRQELRS